MTKDAAFYWSLVLCLGGLIVFGSYLYQTALRGSRGGATGDVSQPNPFLTHDRPWRRLGAAICALLSVMFFIGINYLDPRRSPAAYITFWAIMLLLVLWVCILAIIDILRTRRLRQLALMEKVLRYARSDTDEVDKQ